MEAQNEMNYSRYFIHSLNSGPEPSGPDLVHDAIKTEVGKVSYLDVGRIFFLVLFFSSRSTKANAGAFPISRQTLAESAYHLQLTG